MELYTQKFLCKRALLDKNLVREKMQVPELHGLTQDALGWFQLLSWTQGRKPHQSQRLKVNNSTHAMCTKSKVWPIKKWLHYCY